MHRVVHELKNRNHPMKTYEADLGKWERGIKVTLEAKDREEALKKFDNVLKEEIEDGKLPSDSIIVQFSEEGVCVYDYMNGFYKGR